MEKQEDEDLAPIKTGNGFQNDLIATNAHRGKVTIIAVRELTQNVKELIDAQKESTATIDKLIKMTEEQGKENTKLQSAVYWLTVITVGLAIAQVFFAFVALKNPTI